MSGANISKRKKIAVVFPKDSESVFNDKKRTFGGATVQLYNFAEELSNRHDVFCILNETENIDSSRFPNFNIVFSYGRKDNIIRKIIKFHRSLRQVKPDVVIQRGLTRLSPFLGLYCKLYGAKFIFMFAHDREARGRFQRSNRYNIFYPFIFPFSDNLIVQNDYQLQSMPVSLNGKVHKIRNGYPINKCSFDKKDGVLWVGRLESWKRPEKFIELAHQLPGIKFTMIAPEVEGNEDYARMIYESIKGVKNLQLMHFVGFHEIDKYFRQSRLFINTSIEEGFPNTFIQSCKNYTPIVSLKVNPDNFIDRFKVGICCNDDDKIMLNAVKQFFNGKDILSAYSGSAYDYAHEFHSIEENAKMLEKLF